MNSFSLYKDEFSYLLCIERDLEINFPSTLMYFYYLKMSELAEVCHDDY